MNAKLYIKKAFPDKTTFTIEEVVSLIDGIPEQRKIVRDDLKEVLRNKLVDVYAKRYFQISKSINNEGIYPAIGNQDYSAIKNLIPKLENCLKQKDIEITPDETVNTFKMILENITDKWILSNFSLPLINSKFNSILLNVMSSGINGKSKYNGLKSDLLKTLNQ
jgi:hypothetical protein